MEKQKLLENKRAIAIYMGADEDSYPKGVQMRFGGFSGTWQENLHDFNYDTDWNWLMPVVEKIAKDYDVRITWMPNAIDVTYIDRPDVSYGEIASIGGLTAIENTFLTVVKFLEWYNRNHIKTT